MITPETRVDEMVERYPDAVRFLMSRGLPCVVCGEPFWGSLEELCRQKGWPTVRLAELVDEFNRLHS
ncbi:MAG TPA: DUF1858 domain-containing protein [candidate division Zixibacteria bacterium]|nr:DUF1858 domain-containing protein [candidate division Zixibacteria bacterium]MDD4917400.1 DUF1858 domain-containing protein [candidate division Zixibacteria bacterium]MDM7972398.1 DUF1858 domain-containing protein [candidate division Zixibacteria bacterium]HOD66202.1 DUF1858 domain-containing protein [candidate division Zixibacteria bacterium]HOZ07305.1 DUF1858 domain-containing protein [candidate division Zixibacteria bacterium]